MLFDNDTERVVHSFRVNELDRKIWEKEIERAYEDIGNFYLGGKKYELSESELKVFAYRVPTSHKIRRNQLGNGGVKLTKNKY